MIPLSEMTLSGLCLRSAEKYTKRPALGMFKEGALCSPVNYRLLGIRSRQIGSLLGQLGIQAGDRVLLLSENRPEWPLAYFGIAFAGAVSVPALTGFSSRQIQNICEHAGVSAICLSRAMAAKIETSAVPLIFIDSITNGSTADGTSAHITVSLNGTEKDLSLRASGSGFPRRSADDIASIIYTSGTLGNSKGVMLSSRNLVSCALASLSLVTIFPRDRLLSVIPLAHAYECTLGLLAAVISGASITYLDRPPSPSVLLPAAQALRPTAMVTVPLFIEKIYRNTIAPKLKQSILYRFPLTRPLAFHFAGLRLGSALGGSIRFFGIGGAPLSAEVEDFLHKIRFPYAPGYGLTETAPLTAGTAPYRFSRRSAGSAPAGVELRITDGEIQVRGPHVMMGYYRDEAQTREAFTADGWLKTGDLGCLDKKGRLFVKGRLKALILGPSGENIYPEEIEGLLNTSNLVEDALVYPGEQGELIAQIHISETAKVLFQTAANAAITALEDLRAWANKRLAAFSRLSRIELREEPFEKTPTHKIKRYLYVRPCGESLPAAR
ncbi:MAG: AMP-binding protein [Treponema sp.]|nr:AMP-binding protein [Treponema sp.]